MSVKKSNQRTLVWSLIVGLASMIWIVYMSVYSQPEFEGWLPGQLSSIAANTDRVFYFIYYWSILFFVGVLGEYIININKRVMRYPYVLEEERINLDD